MHATSPPTSSSCTLRNTSQSAPQLLRRCPLNVLPHHCVGRNELASVQADWALFSRAFSLLVACGLVALRILARSRIHMHRVYEHVLSREETQAHADIAHGHGGVPVPAAVRLQACRPLLPSAAAAGMPQFPRSARGGGCRGRLGFEPAGHGQLDSYRRLQVHAQAHGQAGHRPGLLGAQYTRALGLPQRGLRSGLGVGPCIQNTAAGGRSRARAVHDIKQDAGACNCWAATRQGEDTAIRKGQNSSSLPNFVSVDTVNVLHYTLHHIRPAPHPGPCYSPCLHHTLYTHFCTTFSTPLSLCTTLHHTCLHHLRSALCYHILPALHLPSTTLHQCTVPHSLAHHGHSPCTTAALHHSEPHSPAPHS